jgi:hypothetical protein
MTTQLVATYQSTQASITQFQARTEQSAVSVQASGKKPPPPPPLNAQQQQIVDDVDITDAALEKFQEAQIVAQKLQDYLEYLKGDSSESLTRITAPTTNDNDPSLTVQGRSSSVEANITKASFSQETLKIAAEFDDDGNLTSLAVDKTTVTAEYVSAEIITEDRQFFAAVG